MLEPGQTPTAQCYSEQLVCFNEPNLFLDKKFDSNIATDYMNGIWSSTCNGDLSDLSLSDWFTVWTAVPEYQKTFGRIHQVKTGIIFLGWQIQFF